MDKETVAVLGASPNPERYAHRAVAMLTSHGHTVIPVTPSAAQVRGLATVADLSEITEAVDTLTLYVGPEKVAPLIEGIVALRPRRVILNPGTESPALKEALHRAQIPYEEACTLVMLASRTF